MKIKKAELAIILNLCSFEIPPKKDREESSKGWKRRKHLLERREKNSYDSGYMNLCNHMNKLEFQGLVESRFFKFSDERSRKHRKKQYRLIQTLDTYDFIDDLLHRAAINNLETGDGDNPGNTFFLFRTDFAKTVAEKYDLIGHIKEKIKERSETNLADIAKKLKLLKELERYHKNQLKIYGGK